MCICRCVFLRMKKIVLFIENGSRIRTYRFFCYAVLPVAKITVLDSGGPEIYVSCGSGFVTLVFMYWYRYLPYSIMLRLPPPRIPGTTVSKDVRIDFRTVKTSVLSLNSPGWISAYSDTHIVLDLKEAHEALVNKSMVPVPYRIISIDLLLTS